MKGKVYRFTLMKTMNITGKSIAAVLLAVLLAAVLFSGCVGKKGGRGSQNNEKTASSNKKIRIVTTGFAQYDWVKHILGEKTKDADLTMLLDNGVDMHSYRPSAADIKKIRSCDLFIYAGGESDEWAEKALKDAENKNMKTVNMLDAIGKAAKQEEEKEGMMPEDDEDEKKDEGPEYDEHVWLSVRNAKTLTGIIAKDLEDLDKDNAEEYRKNESAYRKKLNMLDEQYQNAAVNSRVKTLIFGDRFPFRYLTDDYGIDYYAAFAGCSAETEASFKTVSFLAKKADSLGIRNIMTIEGSDRKIAETIIRNTKKKNQKILTLDSMQQVTSKDMKNGKTYIGTMENNLKVLNKALQQEKK